MNYYSEDIGSVIKSTLHEYRWDFTIENKEVFIQLYHYRISNIRKVVYNQKVLREEHATNENYYSFEFIMDGHHYKIIQSTGDIAQLYIDDISFDYIYTLDRNKREFEGNKVGKICDIYTKEDEIQSSNEIEFFKHDKSKEQKVNLNFDIKSNNSLNKKQNNLNKFKFDSGENIRINKENNDINNINYNTNKISKANNNINNLIDFDNESNDNNSNKNNFNNFGSNLLDNQNNNYNNMNSGQNNFNILDNVNLNFNGDYKNNFINNTQQKKFNYNFNSGNNNEYSMNNNNFNMNSNNYNNINNTNLNYNEKGNNFQNNMNYINQNLNQNNFNNNNIPNFQGNRKNDYNNIDISYYGF